MIFVFGSNLSGIHGAGAALEAKHRHGAMQGLGVGRSGNSYAIPTKDHHIQTMHLADIIPHIEGFVLYAKNNPESTFQVTQIGCGLAGFTANTIAPLFRDMPFNCQIDQDWSWWLPEHKVWGTY